MSQTVGRRWLYGHDKRDWPVTLAGAHGRIDAYRLALAEAERELFDARGRTANGRTIERLNRVLSLVRAELDVTNP